MLVKRKSPQEKKALSYAKDRRNAFGQNDKASRKNIPRNKRIRARLDRHQANQALAQEPAEDVETALHRPASWRSWWRKLPDAPLGEVVARKLARRRDRTVWKTAKQHAFRLMCGEWVEPNGPPVLPSPHAIAEINGARPRVR